MNTVRRKSIVRAELDYLLTLTSASAMSVRRAESAICAYCNQSVTVCRLQSVTVSCPELWLAKEAACIAVRRRSLWRTAATSVMRRSRSMSALSTALREIGEGFLAIDPRARP
jgi:hypothetical protein